MLVHRSGVHVVQCDGCFAVREPGTPGWQVEVGIMDARPARALRNKPGDPLPALVLQARQHAHACPACATPYGQPLGDVP